MYSDSSNVQASGETGEQPRSGAASAPQASRLVIRDERKDKSLASDERSGGEIDTDYESEIYRLESRGGRGVIVAYPVPLESANPYIAHIDWCAFTVKPPQFKTHLWVISA